MLKVISKKLLSDKKLNKLYKCTKNRYKTGFFVSNYNNFSNTDKSVDEIQVL